MHSDYCRIEEINMEKKNYNGLKMVFVPMEGASIITASKKCSIISVQYYVNQYGWAECDTEGAEGGDEYSYNWDQVPHFD